MHILPTGDEAVADPAWSTSAKITSHTILSDLNTTEGSLTTAVEVAISDVGCHNIETDRNKEQRQVFVKEKSPARKSHQCSPGPGDTSVVTAPRAQLHA